MTTFYHANKPGLKVKIIELPTFEQLTPEEQEKVISNYSDINTDYEWYKYTYEDAENIGLKITSFGLYPRSITGELTESGESVAKAILKNHGEACETYQTAKNFLDKLEALNKKFPKNEEIENEVDFICELENLENDFKNSLLMGYIKLLREEYEYLTSEEAIKETLISNEYTFNRETLKIEA